MDTHEENAAVEAIPVLTAEEVDGIEEWIGWREEGFKGDIGIEDDCVAVNPAAIVFSETSGGTWASVQRYPSPHGNCHILT